MRVIVIVAACLGFAGSAYGQDTLKTWKSGDTICGIRRVGSQVRRFVAIDTGHGLTYDFAPSEETWSYELCDRDPNAPLPSIADMLADLKRSRPSCEVQRQSWAKTSPAMRRKITELNARVGGNDCGLEP